MPAGATSSTEALCIAAAESRKPWTLPVMAEALRRLSSVGVFLIGGFTDRSSEASSRAVWWR